MRELGRIVGLRERQVDQLRQDEQAAVAASNYARDMMLATQMEVDNYLEAISTLEPDLLNDLLDKEITVKEILKVEVELKKAEEEAQKLSDTLELAKKKLRESEEKAEGARRNRTNADSRLKRISEVHKLLIEENRLATTQAEEAELDAFVEIMTARKWTSR